MTVCRTLGLLIVLLSIHVLALAEPLTVGTKAPDFTLKDHQGKEFRLHDFIGKKYVVLAFYVKAFTRG